MPDITEDGLSDLWFGGEKEAMQMALRKFETGRRFIPVEPVKPLEYQSTPVHRNDLYNPGSRVKVRVDTVDPFVDYPLKKGTEVIVVNTEVKGKNTRVICKDFKDALWSLPSRDVERLEDSPEKIGRFGLLD